MSKTALIRATLCGLVGGRSARKICKGREQRARDDACPLNFKKAIMHDLSTRVYNNVGVKDLMRCSRSESVAVSVSAWFLDSCAQQAVQSQWGFNHGRARASTSQHFPTTPA